METSFEKNYIYEDEETQVHVIADGKNIFIHAPPKDGCAKVEAYPAIEDTLENRKKYVDIAIRLTAERRK